MSSLYIKKKTVYLFCLFLFSAIHLFAEDEKWPVFAIPDSLMKEANSVVRDYQVEVEVKSLEKSTVRYKRVITVLNKKGRGAAVFYTYEDFFNNLSHFSGEIQTLTGERVQKIKKSDLETSKYSESFMTDNLSYSYSPEYAHYPFTIVYEWEITQKKGYASYASFVPMQEFKQSVEKASYTLILPFNTSYNTISERLTLEKKAIKLKEQQKETWWLKTPIKAYEDEYNSPSFLKKAGYMFNVPLEFTLNEHKGKQDSWKSLAHWQYQLLKGRDQLLPEQVAQLRAMTDTISTVKGKVNFLYKYLGKTTRYVSIQLGIGGLQPIPAAEVARVGFGDCKGLSNYLRAMLAAIDIPSYYTVISMKNKQLHRNMPNLFDSDHVILTVPLEKDTCYLECTNTSFVTGYLHSDIVGHDAILIDEERGGLIQLPAYPDTIHQNIVSASLVLSEEGIVSNSQIDSRYTYDEYEFRKGLAKESTKTQVKYIKREISIPQCTVNNVKYDVKKNYPQVNLSYTIDGSLYTTKVGDRIFIPINPFRSYSVRRARRKRRMPLELRWGSLNTDTLHLMLPDGFEVESLPRNKSIESDFGHVALKTHYLPQENTVEIIMRLELKNGTYAAEKYKKYERFLRKYRRIYKEKIVIKKKSVAEQPKA
jgi:hypothetical protein